MIGYKEEPMRRTIFGTLVPSDEPESDNEKAMMDILHYAKNVGIETVDTPIDIQFVARLLKAYDDKLGHIKRICASKIVNEELLKSEKDGHDYEEYIKRDIARQIGYHMYDQGLIKFEKKRNPFDMECYQVRFDANVEIIESRRD